MNPNSWPPFFRLLLTISVGAIVGELLWRALFDMLRVQPEVRFLGPLTIIQVSLYWLVYGPLSAGLAFLLRRRMPEPFAAGLAGFFISYVLVTAVFLVLNRDYATEEAWSRWLGYQRYYFVQDIVIALCITLAVHLRPEASHDARQAQP